MGIEYGGPPFFVLLPDFRHNLSALKEIDLLEFNVFKGEGNPGVQPVEGGAGPCVNKDSHCSQRDNQDKDKNFFGCRRRLRVSPAADGYFLK